jgi:hypothetical protein
MIISVLLNLPKATLKEFMTLFKKLAVNQNPSVKTKNLVSSIQSSK